MPFAEEHSGPLAYRLRCASAPPCFSLSGGGGSAFGTFRPANAKALDLGFYGATARLRPTMEIVDLYLLPTIEIVGYRYTYNFTR